MSRVTGEPKEDKQLTADPALIFSLDSPGTRRKRKSSSAHRAPTNFLAMAFDDGYIRDGWPKMPDNTEYDGKRLLALVRAGNSPFRHAWDVNLLIHEVEKIMGTQVLDIPFVSKGSNNYVSVCTKAQQHPSPTSNGPC